MATFVVSNTNDSGAGSLRQAILDANLNPGPDTITFTVVGMARLPCYTPPVFLSGNFLSQGC